MEYKNLHEIFKELGLSYKQSRFYSPRVQQARKRGELHFIEVPTYGRKLYRYITEDIAKIVKSQPFGIKMKQGRPKKERKAKEPKKQSYKINVNIPLMALSKLGSLEKVEAQINKLIPVRKPKQQKKYKVPCAVNSISILKRNLDIIRQQDKISEKNYIHSLIYEYCSNL